MKHLHIEYRNFALSRSSGSEKIVCLSGIFNKKDVLFKQLRKDKGTGSFVKYGMGRVIGKQC